VSEADGAGTGYRRDRFTWAAFAALLAFGVLNAVLGPALPYLRAVEGVGYVVGALHQVAFAVGGGLAGLAAGRAGDRSTRSLIVRVGLAGAAVAGLGVGYGNVPAVTVSAAFLVSLLGTSALVRLWAALADAHGRRRAVALTEGEVSVSIGGIVAPLLVGGLSGTVLGWRFAFVVGAAVVLTTVALIGTVVIPEAHSDQPHRPVSPAVSADRRRRPAPTLVLVFAVVALEWALSFWLASYLADSVGLNRGPAVLLVAGLYAANLVGRLAASRLAHHVDTERLLGGSLLVCLAGTPILLAATSTVVAVAGLVVLGAGIGATFPLASSVHVGASGLGADGALGQVFATSAIGQVLGPLSVGAIAQVAGLRVGLLVLPALAVTGAGALARHHHQQPDR
jgi:MFS family permease